MTDLTPETIRNARQALGLTQEQFAERIGCSALAVSFWERGTRTPTGLYAKAVRELVAEAAAVHSELITTPPPAPPVGRP